MASDDDPSSSAPIIRRHPTGDIPVGADPQTSIIRRHPTGEFTAAGGEEPQTSYIPRARPAEVTPKNPWPDPRTSIATAILSILSGWATAVIATDLITGWWASDLLFCVAVGFLALVSSGALISGLIALLLRRRTARLLVVVGSVIGLMIFASLFVAGAKLAPVVYA
ncbi:MAG: hypothetical protein ACXWZ2_02830, partial [Mycobacterium sp.]